MQHEHQSHSIEKAARTAVEVSSNTRMTDQAKLPGEWRFKVVFREIERMRSTLESMEELYLEGEEIERLRRIVNEVTDERPQFFTST